jgi:hypothetical protein
MAEKILLALSTFPDAETARQISHQLVTERFAACANMLPSVESIRKRNARLLQAQRGPAISVSGQTAFASSLRCSGDHFRSGCDRAAGIPAVGGGELRQISLGLKRVH